MYNVPGNKFGLKVLKQMTGKKRSKHFKGYNFKIKMHRYDKSNNINKIYNWQIYYVDLDHIVNKLIVNMCYCTLIHDGISVMLLICKFYFLTDRNMIHIFVFKNCGT